MKNKKEEWIDKMMREAKGAEVAVHAKKEVFDKIQERIKRLDIKNSIAFRQFQLAGAAAIAIFAINISIIAYTKVQGGPNKEINTAYNLSTYNLDLY